MTAIRNPKRGKAHRAMTDAYACAGKPVTCLACRLGLALYGRPWCYLCTPPEGDPR